MSEALVRKLMALAEHPNTNPNEAANAAARAAEIALKHNIDMAALGAKDDRPIGGDVKQRLTEWHIGTRDQKGLWVMSVWVGRLYGTIPLMHQRAGKVWWSFSGREHNIELSHHWLKFLWESCKKANTEHARSEKYGSREAREEARGAFRLHFCLAVSNKLREKYESMRTQDTPGVGTALMVVNWQDQERQAVQQWIDNAVEVEEVKMRNPKQVVSAVLAGREAGRRQSVDDHLANNAVETKRISK